MQLTIRRCKKEIHKSPTRGRQHQMLSVRFRHIEAINRKTKAERPTIEEARLNAKVHTIVDEDAAKSVKTYRKN